MNTKPIYRTTTKTFPFSHIPPCVPIEVWIQAMLESQQKAVIAVEGMVRSYGKVELFWLTYNFEFRKHIERWLNPNADFEERSNKAQAYRNS